MESFYYNPIKLKSFGTDIRHCYSVWVRRQIQVLQKHRQYKETEEIALTRKRITK